MAYSTDDDAQSAYGSAYATPRLKTYTTPTLTQFGDLRDVSKGTLAYMFDEGFYQEMNPPMS